MTKKVIILLSFFCYLAVTTGVIMNFHYCMKKLASVHIYETAADECGNCGMDMHDGEMTGCCRDDIKVVKLDQDERPLVLTSYDIPSLEPIEVIPSVFILTPFENIDEQRHYHNHSPPLLSMQDTYLHNNVFRI